MSSQNQLNILVIIPDQYRRDFVGAYGGMPIATPAIDRLAAEGVLFTNATTPSPQCAPARACLASGAVYDRCGVVDNREDFDPGRPTFYRVLRDAGYQVGTVGKLDLHKATKYWGQEGDHLLPELGFTHGIDNEGKLDAVSSYRRNGNSPAGPYMAFLESLGLASVHADDFASRDKWLDTYPTPLPDEAYCDNWIARKALRVLDAYRRDRSWYLAVNFTGPHKPQDVTAQMQEPWLHVEFPPAVGESTVDPRRLNAVRQNYAAMCANIDRHVAALLERIAERGELDRTVIIFTSDHGEMLGDHDRWGKGVWYRQSLSIPMIVSAPGGRAGERSSALVQLQDIAATALDYAGVSSPFGEQSRSLRALVEGGASASREYAICGLREWRCVIDGRWKLVRGTERGTLLYDCEGDPDESHDCGAEHPDTVSRLLSRIDDVLA